MQGVIMSKLVHLACFFLVCLLLSIQGFSAQIITVGGEGGGLGIVGPGGETFVFYGEVSDEVSIKECRTNRTFFENSRYDCTQKEETQIKIFSQADFRSHLKFVLNWLPIQNHDPLVQLSLELWHKNNLITASADQLRKGQDKIKVDLTQIEGVILAYGAESADMAEKQALESKLASIKSQLEVRARFDELHRKVNQWIDNLMAAIMSSESFIVYNFAQHKMDFDFNVLRKAIQLIHFNTNDLIRVKPVPFLMGSPSSEKDRDSDEYQHSVTLEYAFEMQATKETQLRWVHVMGYNPSYFHKKKYCPDTHMQIEIRNNKDNKVSLCPNHPVERVSWWSVVVYANRLSEQKGLTPVYDLSHIEFDGIAAAGTLKAISGELKINALDDNIYNTEGFRLPTEAEWEYAARAGMTTPFGLGDGENISADMANYDGRYPYKTTAESIYRKQTVSMMSLSNTNGFGFSHMYGNVWEWVHDWYNSEYYHNSPNRNPLGPSSGHSRTIRGGSWFSMASSLRCAKRVDYDPNARKNTVGFRLLRTTH